MTDYAMTVAFPMHWGDMDALGHANNTCYFRWFETARIACFERVSMTPVGRPATGPILATITCDYLRPLVYPADLVVGLRVTKIGNTSVTMEYGLWQAGAPQTLHARGSSVIVLVDYATGEKLRLPDDTRAALAALVRPA
jgi:acyl-CoA thioester hydrolase